MLFGSTDHEKAFQELDTDEDGEVSPDPFFNCNPRHKGLRHNGDFSIILKWSYETVR